MKAIVYTKYGAPDVLSLQDVPRPEPAADQILVKVVAASVNALDWHMMRADPFLARFAGGLLKPRNTILGADAAGTVDAIGSGVTRFKPGDAVFGNTGSGAFAEYVCRAEVNFAAKPKNVTFEQAAAVPVAALTALQALRDKGRIQPGQKVLINGASGGVGTFAVQLAKYFGANVTATCSTAKVDQTRALGADHVIDYTREDVTVGAQRFDLILAVNGYHPLRAYKRILAENGSYFMAGGTNAQIFESLLLGRLLSRGGKTLGVVSAAASQADLELLGELLAAAKIVPVIDRRYPLSDVPDAIRYMEEGHVRGKVVIDVAQGDAA